MSAFLSREDVVRLTGRKRFGAQRAALDEMRVRYTVAATGEPLVRADAIDAQGKRSREPRWERIGA